MVTRRTMTIDRFVPSSRQAVQQPPSQSQSQAPPSSPPPQTGRVRKRQRVSEQTSTGSGDTADRAERSILLPSRAGVEAQIKLFLIAISTDPRQLGESIEKVPGSLITSQQLVDWSSFFSCVFALFVDTFSTVASVDVVFLDTFLDRCLDTSRHLYRSRFTKPLYIGSVRSGFSFHSISLSIASCFLFPNLSHSLQTSSSRFLQAFTRFFFFHLVSFKSLVFMHFHVSKLGFGVFENFWDFSKLMKFWWNFWVGICLCDLKTSCITSHVHYNSIIMHLVVCKLIVC